MYLVLRLGRMADYILQNHPWRLWQRGKSGKLPTLPKWRALLTGDVNAGILLSRLRCRPRVKRHMCMLTLAAALPWPSLTSLATTSASISMYF